MNKLLFFSILWLTARTADIESSLGPQSRLRAALFPLSSKSSEGTPAAAVPAMVESAITTTTTAEPTTISLMVTSPATTEYETTIKAVSCPNGQDPIIDETSCFILCPRAAVFYDSPGPKPKGMSCIIKEYLQGTNSLKAKHSGTCNGGGRCIKRDGITVTTMGASSMIASTTPVTGTTVTQALSIADLSVSTSSHPSSEDRSLMNLPPTTTAVA